MFLPIKPVCKSGCTRKDGTNLIFIQYCFNSEKRTLLSTEIAIPIKYWNKKSLSVSDTLPSNFGKASELNQQIRNLVRKAEDIIDLGVKYNESDLVSFLKNHFNLQDDISTIESRIVIRIDEARKNNPKTNLDLYFQIDDYIRSKTHKVCPGMLRIYRNMKAHLQAFEEFRKKNFLNRPENLRKKKNIEDSKEYKSLTITFESFDLDFYESFVDFLAYDYVQERSKRLKLGLKVNTIGKTIKQLRIFLNNRMRRKIIPPIDLDDYKVLTEEVDSIYLNRQEINKIHKVSLSDYPHLETYRSLFVLGCLTGLRFSDFSTLQRSDFRNGMLYKKQQKSDGWVVIPLRKEIADMFENEFKEDIPTVINSEFNLHIKELGRIAGITELIKFSYKKGHKDVVEILPKYEWITSHTCRRSFCTNEFLAGTPVELIMKISGHKSVKDFYKYIRISPEEAAQKIMKLWQNRGDMEMFAGSDIKPQDE
jgi:integrase